MTATTPVRAPKGKVEWTNRAKQIVFRASHLFLFGGEAGGVEVRRAESGEVLQTLGLKDDAGDEASASRTARVGRGVYGVKGFMIQRQRSCTRSWKRGQTAGSSRLSSSRRNESTIPADVFSCELICSPKRPP